MTLRLSPPRSRVQFRVHPRRLLVAPRVEVISTGPRGAEAAVHGLVCGACAARTRSALRVAPGVWDAWVDLEAGTATLSLTPGAQIEVDALRRAVERVVVGMALRRVVERIAGTLRALRQRRGEGRLR